MSKAENRFELLAPAKDADVAIAAVRSGADAVYMGAARFSARRAAANSLDDIRRAVDFAHRYWARVYIALNTLLYDDELPAAEKLINELYAIGIDGLIIQDTGLLELDLPPIPLIASTQMDNAIPEKVRFLERAGFSRVILARELSLDRIRAIREQTAVELEAFIHGALCVSASGRCWVSYALGGRSGNRGQCAQPCRRRYTLKDASGQTLAKDRYLLSLKDLNLAGHLEALINAGVTSFKIEGRLKDLPYVVNTVSYYRQYLDAVLHRKGLRKASSGTVAHDFDPDPVKTFTRGFTAFNITGRCDQIGSIDTPKSLGEYVGTVRARSHASFTLDTKADLHSADGICFFDPQNNLTGTVINRIDGREIVPRKMTGIQPGTAIYRNYDHAFIRRLSKCPARRNIPVTLALRDTPAGVTLHARDEDNIEAAFELPFEKQPAQKPDLARQNIHAQLAKLGKTVFECTEVKIETGNIWFFPLSVLNQLKRGLVDALLTTRESRRPRLPISPRYDTAAYPETYLTYTGNVLNDKARAFYRRHGVQTIEPAAESGLDLAGKLVMTTKYCLRNELGQCRPGAADPLILVDGDGREYLVEFQCDRCGMTITLQK